MCGICGYTGKRDDALMERMLDIIRHRGPNDQGSYADGIVNLGMVRLSIIDLGGGSQPQFNEDRSLIIVFNGEIFNYVELRAELEAKGHRFKTLSDTETIVHGYEEYGLGLPDKLNGMFAIAIWDKLKKKLVLIRDRFGVKPLFYAAKNPLLVFGSEIKALLKHPAVGREIDNEALSYYFSLRNVPAPFTIYKDIRALCPGCMLVWDGSRAEVSKWYELPMERKWEDSDEDVLVDKIDALVRDSVKLRLRSDVNYGAYLSGGIDSSMIVAIMSQNSSHPVKTFNLTYADAPKHKMDAYYARKVAERYSTEHREYVMDVRELRDGLPDVLGHLDQPFAGVIASYWLSRYMKDFVTVALSGDGADDLFASYGHHRLVWPIGAVNKARREGRDPSESDFGFFKDRKDFVLGLAGYEPWEWRLSYAAFMDVEKDRMFSDRGRELFSPFKTSLFLKGIYERCGAGADELNRMLYLDINTLLHNEILYFHDMLSMANSLEVRTPFLDYRLAELAASIPGTLKIKEMTLKYILRRAAAKYLPKDILERPKEGFVLPKNTWLREGMAPMMKSALSPGRLSKHGYFDQGQVDALVARFASGDDSVTFKVWTLIVFQIWYEAYLNGSL